MSRCNSRHTSMTMRFDLYWLLRPSFPFYSQIIRMIFHVRPNSKQTKQHKQHAHNLLLFSFHKMEDVGCNGFGVGQGWGEYWTYEYEYWKISTGLVLEYNVFSIFMFIILGKTSTRLVLAPALGWGTTSNFSEPYKLQQFTLCGFETSGCKVIKLFSHQGPLPATPTWWVANCGILLVMLGTSHWQRVAVVPSAWWNVKPHLAAVEMRWLCWIGTCNHTPVRPAERQTFRESEKIYCVSNLVKVYKLRKWRATTRNLKFYFHECVWQQ